jgi:Fic family protein
MKDHFWRRHGPLALTDRQIRVLNRLLDAGPGGFVGGLTTRKYVAMTKVSDSTAKRDIQDLVDRGCLVQTPGTAGRNVRYEIAWITDSGR